MSSASNNKRSRTDSGVSVDKRQKRKNQLLIPIAKYGKVGDPLKDITPERYKDMHEVQTAVRDGKSCLQCPDGHDKFDETLYEDDIVKVGGYMGRLISKGNPYINYVVKTFRDGKILTVYDRTKLFRPIPMPATIAYKDDKPPLGGYTYDIDGHLHGHFCDTDEDEDEDLYECGDYWHGQFQRD
jgi:hypothetical protein